MFTEYNILNCTEKSKEETNIAISESNEVLEEPPNYYKKLAETRARINFD